MAEAEVILKAMHAHPLGERAGRVAVQTVFGEQRIVDMLVGEQLPRVC